MRKRWLFKREDRVPTVKEFLALFTSKSTAYKLPLFLIPTLLIAGLVYTQFFQEVPQGVSETEIRSELEFTIGLENYRNDIDELLNAPKLSESWEDDLWEQVQGAKNTLDTSEKWLASSTNTEFSSLLTAHFAWYEKTILIINTYYLEQIGLAIKESQHLLAKRLIKNAYRYSKNPELLEQQSVLLASAIIEANNLLAEQQRKQKAIQDATKSKSDLKPSPDNKAKNSNTAKKLTAEQKLDEEFKVAFANVQTQLQCQANKLSMRNLETAIQKARAISTKHFSKREGQVVTALTGCISHIAKPFPERGVELKKQALRIFKKQS